MKWIKQNETRIDHDAMVYPNRVLKPSSLKKESTGQSALGKRLATIKNCSFKAENLKTSCYRVEIKPTTNFHE